MQRPTAFTEVVRVLLLAVFVVGAVGARGGMAQQATVRGEVDGLMMNVLLSDCELL